jgi:hypothetical protein
MCVSLVQDEAVESLVRTLAEHLASWGGVRLQCVFDRRSWCEIFLWKAGGNGPNQEETRAKKIEAIRPLLADMYRHRSRASKTPPVGFWKAFTRPTKCPIKLSQGYNLVFFRSFAVMDSNHTAFTPWRASVVAVLPSKLTKSEERF